jgi:vacuolar-type H+-ATPase subunit I/STV1
MPDYKAAANELKGLVQTLGVTKKELQDIATRGEAGQRADEKLKAVETALNTVREIAQKTEITEVERLRKIAQLESDLELLEIINSTSSDAQERLKAQRDISRCAAALGVYKAASVLRVEQLLDDNKEELKAILTEAAKDIQARQNLQRVLKGVEVLLRATAFTAALLSKLAIAGA